MNQQHVRRIVSRLIALGLLTGALFAFSSPTRVSASFATCESCDENFYQCYTVQGGNYQLCRQTYNECLDFCTYDFSSGGGGSGSCGRGRTTCDRDCAQAKEDCKINGGDTCGADYTACEQSCCSS